MTLDETLDDLLHGGEDRHFHPLPTPAAMRHGLFPFQERGHGWLRMLGDLRLELAGDIGNLRSKLGGLSAEVFLGDGL